VIVWPDVSVAQAVLPLPGARAAVLAAAAPARAPPELLAQPPAQCAPRVFAVRDVGI
jgi:hypothetical protein